MTAFRPAVDDAVTLMARTRIVRVLILLTVLLVIWTVVLVWTGGLLFYVGDVRISSRHPRMPALLGLVTLILAWAFSPAGARLQAIAAEYRWLAGQVSRRVDSLPAMLRRPTTIVMAVVASVVAVAFIEGAHVAFAADPYGYVSQARLLATGSLKQRPALLNELSPLVSIDALAPLGYRPSIDGTTIASTYPTGLPMIMAVFERMFGPASVFWVVPILGAVLVWTTYLVGARLGGSLAGVLASTLVATSPPVLYQLTAPPMSDLPAAAWWALSILLVMSGGWLSTFGAGCTSGLAFLTRPNLAPVIAVVGGLLIWRQLSERRSLWQTSQHALLFAAGALPWCVTFLVVNTMLWGAPLTTGYGTLDQLYSVSNIATNLKVYPIAVVMQMPVLVLLAAFVRPRKYGLLDDTNARRIVVVGLWAWALVVFLCYVAYPAFDSSETLRFLVPAVPPLIVLGSLVAIAFGARLTATHPAVSVMLVLALCWYSVYHARTQGTFDREHLKVSSVVGNYVAQRLPERAVVLAMLHSGTATYYSGRQTIRYDFLAPDRLDGVVAGLRRRGYVPYLLLDDGEIAWFRNHFGGHSRYGAIDWPPVATTRTRLTGIYDLAADPSAPHPATEIIPWP